MITVTSDEANRVLTVEMQGMISETDIEEALDRLQERYPQVGTRVSGGERGGIALLLDWERLEGWQKGAKTLGTVMGKMLSDAVRRVAVVADEKWREEQERIIDINKRADVRFFTPARRDQAWTWLRGD